MLITEMDRRYSMYHLGFTHEIVAIELSTRRALEAYFNQQYGPPQTDEWGPNGYWKEYNTNWRKKTQRHRTPRYYLKHPKDLVLIGLKFTDIRVKARTKNT